MSTPAIDVFPVEHARIIRTRGHAEVRLDCRPDHTSTVDFPVGKSTSLRTIVDRVIALATENSEVGCRYVPAWDLHYSWGRE